MSVVTRFPPSPTGLMHIGNARTALFNWLFARHHGGKFAVRIEDTDRKRYSDAAIESIIRGLEWLELDWDGEIVYQFSRQARHVEVAHQLLKNGQAYYCYCTPEELETMRKRSQAEGRKTFYDRSWRDRDPSDAPKGIKPVVRIKAPLEGSTTIEDHVQGPVTVAHDQLDDFIILRSDGSPTYMLSVVVDDFDMGVTHIIRGDDHLNNAFRQKIIFNAMEWDVPEFAHCPLIHGPDGGKFSKRHGATSVEEYRDMGYLPEAMRNYLLRLGWSHGDEEIIPTDKAVEWFDLKGIGKAASRFDFSKLESLNAHYINATEGERLLKLSAPFFESRHGLVLDEISKRRIMSGMDELKSRARTLLQFTDEAAFYAKKVPFAYDEKARKVLCNDSADSLLSSLKMQFESSDDDFTAQTIERTCRTLAENMCKGKLGKVAMPLRAAVTGTSTSPPIFHVCEVLGKEETCVRIHHALRWLKDSKNCAGAN